MTVRPILTAAALAMTATGAAADTFDAAGTGFGQSMSKATPVSDALVVVDIHTDYEKFETMDAASPLAGAKGPCFGSVIIKAGQVSGGGLCNYTDGDGDVAVMSWDPQGMTGDGMTTGLWAVEGGTGKWDGASGGGTFLAGTDAAGVYSNKITGAITLP